MAAPGMHLLMAGGGGAAPFNPATLAPNVAHWYDPTDATTFTFSSGVLVSQWNDKIGTAHIAQATSAKQPHRQSDLINSLDTVTMGASDEEYLSASLTVAQPLTIYVVMQRVGSGLGGNNQIIANASNPSATVYLRGANWALYAGAEVFSGAYDNNAHVLTAIFNGASSALYVDGTSAVSGNPGSAGINGTFRVGSDGSPDSFNGKVGDIIIATSAHGTSDRQAMEAALKTRWATP